MSESDSVSHLHEGQRISDFVSEGERAKVAGVTRVWSPDRGPIFCQRGGHTHGISAMESSARPYADA